MRGKESFVDWNRVMKFVGEAMYQEDIADGKISTLSEQSHLLKTSMKSFPSPLFTQLQYGGDYNPDHWLKYPEVLKEDLSLMRLAKVNLVSVGIFSWSTMEREEGKFTFEWLDRIMDDLAAEGIGVALATPSGARPAWLSEKYPEVLRVGPNRVRNLHGFRHNHCYTSPAYRSKTCIINSLLAERYGKHPALRLWHVSNEYGGECHCNLCQEAFREWLKKRYNNDLNQLNDAWYTSFWSHTYTSWSQVESPAPHGETLVHGQNLDWKRFVTDQTVDFMLHEMEPLRRLAPHIPATTNFMGDYPGLDYWRFAPHLDVISWDSYPNWHVGPAGHGVDHRIGDGADFLWPDNPEMQWGLFTAFMHNINRSLSGGNPFLLIESTPDVTNWQSISKLPRPGMSRLASMQAIAHGSDSVMYFQWRKSRGSSEKFHGAVIGHAGHENTRVFRNVAQIGEEFEKLSPVAGMRVTAEVAVIFDWENRWAIEDAQGPRNDKLKRYPGECMAHAAPFWTRGIPFDVPNMDQDFSGYKLVIAPMLYMLRPGVAERVQAFVEAGGTFVATYFTGWVNESDLCFTGGYPGPLRKILGLWTEEIDALPVGESNNIRFDQSNALGLEGAYAAHLFCELINPESAQVLARYTGDFYAGRAALTVNDLGKGRAYYVAARTEQRFLQDFYGKLAADLGLKMPIPTALPEGVTAHLRSGGGKDFLFVMNFARAPRQVTLPTGHSYNDALSGERVATTVELTAFDVRVFEQNSK